MTKKLSIIIPAFNEEKHLAHCLRSIAEQTVTPFEVIVVDNNSSDGTAEIAKSFPFVTYIFEQKKGLIAARNKGFNIAQGDILGRINADVALDKNWVASAIHSFDDDGVWGVTGPARAHTLPFIKSGYTTFWSKAYFLLAKSDIGIETLWGANMAISSTAWQAIKDDACMDDTKVHEDQDLSVLIASCGQKNIYNNRLLVTTSEQSYVYLPKFIEYSIRRRRTKNYHKDRGSYMSISPYHPLYIAWLRVVIFLPYLFFILLSVCTFPFIWAYSKLR